MFIHVLCSPQPLTVHIDDAVRGAGSVNNNSKKLQITSSSGARISVRDIVVVLYIRMNTMMYDELLRTLFC